MRLAWALLLGTAGGVAAAWWFSRETPEREHAKAASAAKAHAANTADTRPSLYRWRDDAGTLHVTQRPPKKRHYEHVVIDDRPGIEVHGDRR